MAARLDPLHINLLDVLLHLPLLGVVDDSVWQPLPPAGRSSLRQASSTCRQLADSLITDVSLLGSLYLEPQASSSAADSAARPAAPAAPLEGEQLEAWHQAVGARSRFLERLPRLTALQLQRWPGEEALIALLTRYGTATQHRLRKLTLDGAPVSAGAIERVCQACPRLDMLLLYCGDDTGATLHDDVLLPLQQLPSLTLLTMSGLCSVSSAALVSLSRLSRLQIIDLDLRHALPQQLFTPLVALTNLQHCRVGKTGTHLHLLDVAPLFTLSHLTHLDVCPYHQATPLGNPAAEELAAAVAPLAGLVHLRHLSLGTAFCVDDILFAPLRRLPQLTSLHASTFGLSQPPPPRAGPGPQLPALRKLQMHNQMPPSHLLRALEPLLPLPALTDFNDGTIVFELGYQDAADGALQARSLPLVLSHLAQAPRSPPLRHLSLTTNRPLKMACADLTQGLKPLTGRLHSLNLVGMSLAGAGWEALGLALPGLQVLHLTWCSLPGDALGVLVARWPGLARLEARFCEDLTEASWSGLAEGREEALEVCVQPGVCEAQVQQCRALQERLFGRQNLTFFSVRKGVAHVAS